VNSEALNTQRDVADPLDDELADPHEAAEVLGVSYKTLEYWRAQGRGPDYIKHGSARNAAIRYRVGDLRRWVADQQRAQHEPSTGDTVMNAVQQIIDMCARRHQMAPPYRITITDARRQRAGVIVHEDRPEERIPGMAAQIAKAYPPFVMTVRDAEGERKTFDVGVLQAPDGASVPDARQRRH